LGKNLGLARPPVQNLDVKELIATILRAKELDGAVSPLAALLKKPVSCHSEERGICSFSRFQRTADPSFLGMTIHEISHHTPGSARGTTH